MNVCIISREFPPETAFGGIAVFSLDLAKMLRDHGHSVTVISQTLSNKDYVDHIDGVPIYRCRTEYPILPAWHHVLWFFILKYNFFIWKTVLRLHNEKPFDLIDVPDHLAEGMFPSIMGNIPVVTRLHTPFSVIVDLKLNNYRKNPGYFLIKLFERLALKHSDALISPSDNLAKKCRIHLKISSHIDVVGYQIDTSMFKPAKHYINNGQTKILFVGRIEHRKGIHTIADAFPIVHQAIPNSHLTMLGADTHNLRGFSSARDFLQNCFIRNNCIDAVTFRDPVPLNELADVFHHYDIVWVPSLYDNFPLVCLEAMASGKPVVVSDAGGISESLGAKGLVKIFPVGDHKSLARHTIDLARDTVGRNKMGMNASQYVTKNYSYDAIYKSNMAVYERVISLR
jgi:glycosyltransferase involved in cell wall biosynthesis